MTVMSVPKTVLTRQPTFGDTSRRMDTRKQNPGIFRAVEIFGSQTALAKRIGVGQGVVSYWLNSAKQVPPKRAVQIEAVTNGEVTRKELRPDLWG